MKKLVDSFGRVHNYLRISLTERCNLRCLYCMPAEGVSLQPQSHILTEQEIDKLARTFVANGVDKIRLTGGEPTVRKEFMKIVESLGSIEGLNQLAITTNGLTLPRKLPQLKQFGLTGVNISLDTLVEAKYNFFTRRQGLQHVLDAILKSLEVGIPRVKVNCVVMRGQNDDEIADFVAITEHLPVQIRFIEYMPFDGNKWQRRKMLSYLEMIDIIEKQGYQLSRQTTNHTGETSKNYDIIAKNGQSHQGSVGFITSMTSNFCGACNRMRITADGNLKVCLFGNEEVSLRDMLRNGNSEKELQEVVELALFNKKKQHVGIDELSGLKNRPMILIGGHSARRHGPSVSPPVRFARMYSKLTHINVNGEAHMVDVGAKKVTKRRATAVGRIKFSNPAVAKQIADNSNKKGDVLGVARVAGIMAAKQTPNLIPLCHPIATTRIVNNLKLHTNHVDVETTVECVGPTGVEMEALMSATITLNTVYDMCKAIDEGMEITGIRVIEKKGGKSNYNEHPAD